MFRTDRPSSASGFTLVEVLIAVAIFITLSVGVAQLIAVATARGSGRARTDIGGDSRGGEDGTTPIARVDLLPARGR